MIMNKKKKKGDINDDDDQNLWWLVWWFKDEQSKELQKRIWVLKLSCNHISKSYIITWDNGKLSEEDQTKEIEWH